ncbi:MAG: DNA polymerase [Bacteroidota bacterium]
MVNRASIDDGGASKFKNAQNIKGIHLWETELPDQIGCAAVALMRGYYRHEKKIEGLKQRNFYDTCLNLQLDCAFEDPLKVTILELDQFVNLYPEYRVVIFSNKFGIPHFIVGQTFQDKSIYIYHDIETSHYCYITGIREFGKYLKNSNSYRFCVTCCDFYTGHRSTSCRCGEETANNNLRTFKECEDCGAKYRQDKRHVCHLTSCHFCTGLYKDVKDHRCPLYAPPNKKVFHESTTTQKKLKPDYKLWFYDIESHFINTEETVKEFQVDDQGHFTIENGEFKFIVKQRCDQLPNYLYAINGFTNERVEYEDPNAFLDFFMAHNQGYNILIAHNGSGYDTRLLFSYLKNRPDQLKPVLKGTKFMRLVVADRLIFQDSLFHLTMSLASLAKSFEIPMRKGYFPHMFSKLENLEYSGPLPDKSYFDMRYSKSKNDIEDFHKWHDEFTATGQEWNYREQRKLYCINDVEILKEVAMQYHYGFLENLESHPHCQVSPWFFPTMAGHIHKVLLLDFCKDITPKTMTLEQVEEFTQSNAAVLEPMEHYFAKLAMRGGITNIFSYINNTNMHYQDIQSSYPSVQLDKENMYPVGTPIIEVHDPCYYPCCFHYEDPLFYETAFQIRCKHTIEQKKQALEHKSRKSKIIQVTSQDLHDYCDNFFGLLVVDIIPNSERYHQSIQVHDGSRVMPTCHKVFKYPVFSEMLKYEISKGAVVTKIYRADRYKSTTAPWNGGPLSLLYKCKMQHSKTINPLDYNRITETMSKFGVPCDDITTWKKNAVKKQVAKGPITAAWGKHAESVDHPSTELVGHATKESWDFYTNLLENKNHLSKVSVLGGHIMFDYKQNRQVTKPVLDKGYLPWAVAVTSYGRMKLDKEMQRIDPPGQSPRMVMCDTDSVLYSFTEDQYTTPEGDCLGDWETEDFESKHEGIKQFVSCGPKSYIMTAGDGTIVKKLKGISLNHAAENIYTAASVRDNIINNSSPSKQRKRLAIPQRHFKSLSGFKTLDGLSKGGVGGAMTTFEALKYISFHPEDAKGEFREDGQAYRVYPHGYTGVL